MLSVDQRPQWHAICGGSARYVEKLVAPFRQRILLNCPIESVRRLPDGVLVKPRGADTERYDQVFFASHSDQALALLTDATALEKSILGAIPYQANEAVLHTDTSLLPRARRAWPRVATALAAYTFLVTRLNTDLARLVLARLVLARLVHVA